MFKLPNIPVDLDPVRLAGLTEAAADRVSELVEYIRPHIHPAAVFEEFCSQELFPSESPPFITEHILAGLVLFGRIEWNPSRAAVEEPLFPNLIKRIKDEALDFVDYKVRQYLKPAGKSSGERLEPGLPGLPIGLNSRILEIVDPDRRLELDVDSEGRLTGGDCLALIYPIKGYQPAPGMCASCSRKDCPSRLH